MSVRFDSRTGLPAVVKQPAESRVFSMDFSQLLSGASIVAVVSVTDTNQNLVTGSSPITVGTDTFNDTEAQVRLSAGTNREHYKITIIVTDSNSNTLEGDGMLLVEDL